MSEKSTTDSTGSVPKAASGKSGVVSSRAVVSTQPGEELQAEGKSGGGGGGGGINFIDQGGPVLTSAHVYLIFWGSAWAKNATPSVASITSAIATMMTSSYMSALTQYRNIGQALLVGQTLVTASDPPATFTDTDVTNLLTRLLHEEALPAPHTDDQLLYCVMMPVGVGSGGDFIGEHSYFPYGDGHTIHYAWVSNNGTLDFVTTIFSHELVESCTDPEGSAILGTPGSCSQDGWCEIGDVCEGVNAVLNGVAVQKYWSQRDRACIVQSAWESIGGTLVAPPVAVSQAADHLDLFALGQDHAVWHTSWDGTHWDGWKSLGGTFISPPGAISQAANTLDLFALGPDHAVWHKGWDGSNWGAWESLGGILTSAISVVSPTEDRTDLFALGQDHAVWHTWGGKTFWDDWESFGGTFISPPSAVSWGANRLDLFALGTDHVVWHKWWNGINWTDWISLGGTFASPVSAVSWEANRLDLFATGTDNALWHKWWDGASWGGWESLGGSVFSAPTAISAGGGRLHIFAPGADGTVLHKWRGPTGWGGWESLGGAIFSAISPVYWGQRLDIFALGTQSDVWHRWWG